MPDEQPTQPGSSAREPGKTTGFNRAVLKELGGFELIEKIGQGGMGTVFKARQKSLDRIVALKILPASIAKNSKFSSRFQREARASAKLCHPNIVQGIDVGCDSATGLWYFAMEYVDGMTLRQLLKEQRVIPEKRALEMIRDVARALECVAANGMVHRDIKPDNILLTKNGVVKLADLGLAKEVNGDDATLTQSGEAVGTPYYMAPEQVRGEQDKIDIRTDIYSLGATLFHLVTGERPFTGATSAVIMSMHLTEAPPKACDVNHDVSKACTNLILKMMSKKIEQRVQTPRELLDLIEQTLNPASKTGPRAAVRTTGPRAAVTSGPRAAVSGTTGPRAAVTGTQRIQSVKRSKGNLGMLAIGVAALIGVVVLIAIVSGGQGQKVAQTPSTQPKIAETFKETRVVEAPASPEVSAATATMASVGTSVALERNPDPTPELKTGEPAKAVENHETPAPTVAVTPEPDKSKEPPKPATEANVVSRSAYQQFSNEFLTQLSLGNRKAAEDLLAKAEASDALKPLHAELAQDRTALAWLADLDHAVAAGAIKVNPAETFELTTSAGASFSIGGKEGFRVIEVKDGSITIGNKDVTVPIQIAKLVPTVFRKLAGLALGDNAGASLKFAFLSVLEVGASKKNDPATLAATSASIDKAQTGGANADDIHYVQKALVSVQKGALELSAQSAWVEIAKLASDKQWKALKQPLEFFSKSFGATEFAAQKAAEIAEFNQQAGLGSIPMQDLVLWLKADKGVSVTNGHVTSWQDQSGKNNNAIQLNKSDQPVLVPDAFFGGPALQFDGHSSHLDVKGLTGPMKKFTLMFTLKPSSLKNYNQSIGATGSWGQFEFHAGQDGGVFVGTSVRSRFSPGDGPKAGTMVVDSWQQFAYVFDNGKASFFRNGKLLATKKIAVGTWAGFEIGCANSCTLHGDISGLVLYDRALPEAERQAVEKYLLKDNVVVQTAPAKH